MIPSIAADLATVVHAQSPSIRQGLLNLIPETCPGREEEVAYGTLNVKLWQLARAHVNVPPRAKGKRKPPPETLSEPSHDAVAVQLPQELAEREIPHTQADTYADILSHSREDSVESHAFDRGAVIQQPTDIPLMDDNSIFFPYTTSAYSEMEPTTRLNYMPCQEEENSSLGSDYSSDEDDGESIYALVRKDGNIEGILNQAELEPEDGLDDDVFPRDGLVLSGGPGYVYMLDYEHSD